MVVAWENDVCNSPGTAVAAPPRGHGCSTGTSVLPAFCLSPVATKGEERRRKREEREKEKKGGGKASGAAIYIHGRRRAAHVLHRGRREMHALWGKIRARLKKEETIVFGGPVSMCRLVGGWGEARVDATG